MLLELWERETMTERKSARVGFGPYIKALREARPDLTQRQIAQFVGMSQSQYSGMEGNSNPEYLPAPNVVAGIAEFFGISELELIQQAGYMTDFEPSATETGVPRGAIVSAIRQVRQVQTELSTFESVMAELLDEVEAEDARLDAMHQQPLPAPEEVTARRQRATG